MLDHHKSQAAVLASRASACDLADVVAYARTAKTMAMVSGAIEDSGE